MSRIRKAGATLRLWSVGPYQRFVRVIHCKSQDGGELFWNASIQLQGYTVSQLRRLVKTCKLSNSFFPSQATSWVCFGNWIGDSPVGYTRMVGLLLCGTAAGDGGVTPVSPLLVIPASQSHGGPVGYLQHWRRSSLQVLGCLSAIWRSLTLVYSA